MCCVKVSVGPFYYVDGRPLCKLDMQSIKICTVSVIMSNAETTTELIKKKFRKYEASMWIWNLKSIKPDFEDAGTQSSSQL